MQLHAASPLTYAIDQVDSETRLNYKLEILHRTDNGFIIYFQ